MQNKIFVGNLSFNTDVQDLKEVFDKFGEMSEIKIPTDRETGRARGFAFITFETQQAAENALAADGKEISGRAIRVSMATEKKDSGSGSRGGYGESRRSNY